MFLQCNCNVLTLFINKINLFLFPDDLKVIIQTKEEKCILLEEEVEELEAHARKLTEQSRMRELELLHEMDLIHGKNEVSTVTS